MTNLSLNTDLCRRACEIAAAEERAVDEFVEDALRRTVRNGFPVMRVDDRAPVIDETEVLRLLEEEGF